MGGRRRVREVIDAWWDASTRQLFGPGGTRSARRQTIVAVLDDALDGHARRSAFVPGLHGVDAPDPVVKEAAEPRTAPPTC